MIRKRGQVWAVEFWDPVAKRKVFVNATRFGLAAPRTKTQAQQLEKIARKALEAERAEAYRLAAEEGVNTTRTVREYSKVWLALHPRPQVTTIKHHTQALKAVVAEFGDRKLTSITRLEALEFAHAHRHSAITASAMFTDAITDELAARNPFKALGLPQAKGRKNITALTEQEVGQLADCARAELGLFGEVFAAMILTAAYTGVRQGELFGLRHENVDLKNNRLKVEWQLRQDGLARPKNGLARTIVLPDQAAAAITAVYPYAGERFLFVTPQSKPFSKTSFRYHWDPVRRKAGRPQLAWHELRHAAATIMLERGLDVSDVAMQLGHTDGGKLVMDLYGHPRVELARERVEQAFRKVI